MRRLLILLILLSSAGLLKAQYAFEDQIKNFSAAIPSYLYAYTGPVQENMMYAMSIGNQIQHGNRAWKVKYSLALSGLQFVPTYSATHMETDVLGNSRGTVFYGEKANLFGSDEKTTLVQYLLDDDGNRVIDPRNGQYVYFSMDLPGGVNRNAGFVPHAMPYLELKPWKGLILSGGYMPISYFLRDFEKEGFTPLATAYGFGVGLHMNHFTKIPVLSWLRFDYTLNKVIFAADGIESLFDPNLNSIVKLNDMELSMRNEYDANQYRASIAIPISKSLFFILQGGNLSASSSFTFDYKIDAEVDAEEMKKQYGLDVAPEEIKVDEQYSRELTIDPYWFYSGSILWEGRIGRALFTYSNSPKPMMALRLGIRIL